MVSYGGPWTPPFVPPPPPHVCYTPPPGLAVALRFSAPWATTPWLRFLCLDGRALITVPAQRVYIVINTATLLRVSDSLEIPCLGMSLSLDADSYTWGASASLTEAAADLVQPTTPGEPIELQATVNGVSIRFIVESMGRERTFGRATVRIQGRGKAAVLDAPYQPLLPYNNASTSLTAQQIVEGALPSGWTISEWGLTDWLVPAGAWSHMGTPASVAKTVAAAAGGYLQPVGVDDELRVLARYPVAPWDWAGVTPDIELPAAVAQREAIDWAEKARYNGVYAYGANSGGIGALVKRAGSAGDVLAQMITDPLVTHADAARQRGLAVLADTGRQARVTLRVPVLNAIGIVLPGKFIRYVDGGTTRLGLSRSVQVDVAYPEVWQTITVETHID